MNENINQLIGEFERIKNKGYIESIRKGRGSVGLTFEKELGKKMEKSSNPDYMGIEIKTKKSILYNDLLLFSLTPDSYENVIKDIQQKYGYPDKDLRQFKIFYMDVYCDKLNFVFGKKYGYKLKIDYQNRKLIFLICNEFLEIIDDKISWSFESIENRLKQKLTYLAIIDAKRKYELSTEYFKYINMTVYKLRGFNEFLKLLENGKIRITFKIGIYKSGEHYGETYDHGTGFSIDKNQINELFEK